jgi:plasmid replication initiation protein
MSTIYKTKAERFSVSKSNTLVDASYKLNPQAQKLVLACLSKIDPRPDTPEKEIPSQMTMTALEFSELTGIDLKNAHRELYKSVDALYECSIKLFDPEIDDEHEIEVRWIQKKVKKIKGAGAVTLEWSNDVKKYISNLRNQFSSYKLRNIVNLQSGHSIRLYELLMKFKKTGDRVIYIDDFKSYLGISDKYREFKILKRDVINPAVNELNKRTDLTVTYETIKKGRSVAALSFEFKQSAQLKMDI